MELAQTLEIIILIASVVIHEVSHGYMAYWLGDPTAKLANRLNFNPVNHLDLFGSFIVPALLLLSHSPFLFGWAKPVPFNPYNLKNQKYGPALVGIAGPLSNLLLALIAGIIMRAMLVYNIDNDFFLMVLAIIVFINILLMVFNLFPIPPLDGSKLLFAIIPVSEHTQRVLEQYGFMFLIIFLVLFSDIFGLVFNNVLRIFVNNVIGIGLSGFFGLF